jgi:hypothetical protein
VYGSKSKFLKQFWLGCEPSVKNTKNICKRVSAPSQLLQSNDAMQMIIVNTREVF